MHRLRLIGLVERQPTFPSREDQRQAFSSAQLRPNLELKSVFQTWDCNPKYYVPRSMDFPPLIHDT